MAGRKTLFGGTMVMLVVLAGFLAFAVIHEGGGSNEMLAQPSATGRTPAPTLGPTPVPVTPTPVPPPGTPITAPVDVPILMYHIIGPADAARNELLAVSIEDFAAQMDYLACAGFTPITLQRLFDGFSGKYALPEHPIVLTFDDGWASQYANAFPILRKHRFSGSFAIVSSFADAGGEYMNWAQVRVMSDEGMEVMSHSLTHIDLGKEDDAIVVNQLTTSKAALESHMGRAVDYFVYPAGEPFRSGTAVRQAQVVQMVRDAGYKGALLASNVFGRQDPAKPYQLNRIRVETEDVATFAATIGGPAPTPAGCG
jgi:peptidoglycan/xylan/chitin deacetylase (PgdA/CDA1 family)